MSDDSPRPTRTPLDAPPDAPADTPPPRRRGRTALLIAVAAILGIGAGAGTGYEIQYLRPDTPLPPLAQPKLSQPAAPAPSAKPLSAADDMYAVFDGDLRKALLKRPKGARDWPEPLGVDGWEDVDEYAESFNQPKSMFGDLVGGGFRRMAVTSWDTGGASDYVDVADTLVQFRDDSVAYAETHFDSQTSYMSGAKYAGNEGRAIPGTVDGRVWVYDKPWTKAGYLPQYQARALARRGNVVVDIWVYGAKPIPYRTVLSLAERQLERL